MTAPGPRVQTTGQVTMNRLIPRRPTLACTRAGIAAALLLGGLSATCVEDADSRSADAGEADATAGTGDAFVSLIEIDWVELPGGSFAMGSAAWPESQPIHTVTVPAFAIGRTEVTVAQYRACREAGACPPARGLAATADKCALTPERDTWPVACLLPDEAEAFATWVGARLPTEAEWEYAARSGGQSRGFPWGDDPPDCSLAIVNVPGDLEQGLGDEEGCGQFDTWPVCAKPAGNTDQGLCDMAGNLEEWVADDFCPYASTPNDGSAARCGRDFRVLRGGHWHSRHEQLNTSFRYYTSITGFGPNNLIDEAGFRVARSL